MKFCHCGHARETDERGFLACPHCDGRACSGGCARCRTFDFNFRRTHRDLYDLGGRSTGP